MSADNNGFAAPRARDIEHSRRAKVAPLLAAGLSLRAISAETGISVGAVHRAKRHLENAVAQGREKATAISRQLKTDMHPFSAPRRAQPCKRVIISGAKRAQSWRCGCLLETNLQPGSRGHELSPLLPRWATSYPTHAPQQNSGVMRRVQPVYRFRCAACQSRLVW
jgi:hypothetical protein